MTDQEIPEGFKVLKIPQPHIENLGPGYYKKEKEERKKQYVSIVFLMCPWFSSGFPKFFLVSYRFHRKTQTKRKPTKQQRKKRRKTICSVVFLIFPSVFLGLS